MYALMVFLHVLGVVVFAAGHGTSIAVAMRMRGERDRARIAAMLDLSGWSSGLMYAGLLLTIVAGVVLGFMGGFWGQWWLWVSIGLLVLVMGAMYGIATPAFTRLRAVTGAKLDEKQRQRYAGADPDAVLTKMQTSWRPMALALIGSVGLAVILWLMIAQPGG